MTASYPCYRSDQSYEYNYEHAPDPVQVEIAVFLHFITGSFGVADEEEVGLEASPGQRSRKLVNSRSNAACMRVKVGALKAQKDKGAAGQSIVSHHPCLPSQRYFDCMCRWRGAA